MNIGERISKRRKQLNLTQSDLAKLTNLSRVSIGNYERGDRVPNTDVAMKLAIGLGITVDELIYGSYEENNKEYLSSIENNKENVLDFINNIDEFSDTNDLYYVSQFVDVIRKKNKKIEQLENLLHEERLKNLD